MEPGKTALLVMDMQTAILRNLPDPEKVTSTVAKAIASARIKNIPVMYVIVGFREGMPELNVSNKFFKGLKDRLGSMSMAEWMKIDASVAPLNGEAVIIKRRISAFTGSDLDVILRAQNIKHIVLCGVSTSGVVLSTTREAADKDFQITVLENCCADADEEVHRVLTTKVFPRQATVITSEAWIDNLSKTDLKEFD